MLETARPEIHDLNVSADGAQLLRGIDLTLLHGHVRFGSNGSGKSSLLAAIMGLPPFQVVGGHITNCNLLAGDIHMPATMRAEVKAMIAAKSGSM